MSLPSSEKFETPAQEQGLSLLLHTHLYPQSSIPSQPLPFFFLLLGERGPRSPTVRYADSVVPLSSHSVRPLHGAPTELRQQHRLHPRACRRGERGTHCVGGHLQDGWDLHR